MRTKGSGCLMPSHLNVSDLHAQTLRVVPAQAMTHEQAEVRTCLMTRSRVGRPTRQVRTWQWLPMHVHDPAREPTQGNKAASPLLADFAHDHHLIRVVRHFANTVHRDAVRLELLLRRLQTNKSVLKVARTPPQCIAMHCHAMHWSRSHATCSIKTSKSPVCGQSAALMRSCTSGSSPCT